MAETFKNALIEDSLLKLALEQYYNVAIDDVLEQVSSMNRKAILDQHKYSIKYNERDKRYRTYVPDVSKYKNRRPVAKKTLEELEDYLVSFYTSEAENKAQENRKTFKAVFDLVQEKKLKYIKSEEKRLSAENTKVKAYSDYKRFFSDTDFENKYIDTITKKDIEDICLLNLTRYSLRKKAFDALRGILKSVFDMAYSEYWISDNVYQRMDFKIFKNMLAEDVPIEERAHTDEELSAILDELHRKQASTPKFSSIWALELQIIMGLRRGEAPPLEWADISDICITIDKEQLTCGNEFIVVHHTKNYKDRYFPITNDVRRFLKRLKEMQDTYYPNSKYLFPADTDSGIITNRAVYFVYQGICEKLGITISKEAVKGPHSFRRNAITDVVNATNGNIILASQLFGNTPDVAMQNYYTGADLAHAKSVLNERRLCIRDKKGVYSPVLTQTENIKKAEVL